MPYRNAFIVGCKWYLYYIYIPTTSPESSYGLCLDSTRGLSNLQSNLCNLNQTLFPSLQAPQTLQMQHWNDLKGINISSKSHKSVVFILNFHIHGPVTDSGHGKPGTTRGVTSSLRGVVTSEESSELALNLSQKDPKGAYFHRSPRSHHFQSRYPRSHAMSNERIERPKLFMNPSSNEFHQTSPRLNVRQIWIEGSKHGQRVLNECSRKHRSGVCWNPQLYPGPGCV